MTLLIWYKKNNPIQPDNIKPHAHMPLNILSTLKFNFTS